MSKKQAYWLSGFVGVLIIVALASYFLKFKSRPFSDNPDDWATFANYIGGVVNTLIALLGTIILIYITKLIADNSNEQSFKQQMFLRKIDVYKAFVDNFPKISAANRRIEHHINSFNKAKDKADNPEELVDNFKLLIQQEIFAYFELNKALRQLPLAENHLFDYDFDNSEYRNLLQVSNKVVEEVKKRNEMMGIRHDEAIEDSTEEFTTLLYSFIGALRDEISASKSTFSK